MYITITGNDWVSAQELAEELQDAIFEKFDIDAGIVHMLQPLHELAYSCGVTNRSEPMIISNASFQDAVFEHLHDGGDMFQTRLLAVRLLQALKAFRKGKHNGVYVPVVSLEEFVAVARDTLAGANPKLLQRLASAFLHNDEVNIIPDNIDPYDGDYSIVLIRGCELAPRHAVSRIIRNMRSVEIPDIADEIAEAVADLLD